MRGSWHGRGRAVVLLHGQPGAGRDWGLVLARLQDVQAIAPDRPGYDGTPARDFAGNAQEVAALARSSGVDRLVVVGHSWGGGVALQLALDHPQLVAGLCLIGSVGSRLALSRQDRLLALPGVRRAAGVALCGSAAVVPRSFVNATGSQLSRGSRAQVRQNGLMWLRQGGASSFAAEQAFFVRDSGRLADRLVTINVPSLVVAGTADRTVPLAAAADLAEQLPLGRLLSVPGGHLLPAEAPKLVADAIELCVRSAAWV